MHFVDGTTLPPDFFASGPKVEKTLEDVARRLWESTDLQKKWLAAVGHLRTTKRGWIRDQVPASVLKEQAQRNAALSDRPGVAPLAHRVVPIKKRG